MVYKSTAELLKLRAAAEKATSGPWDVWSGDVSTREDAKRELCALVDGTPEFSRAIHVVTSPSRLSPAVTGCGKRSKENATFIAAADPETVVALVAEIIAWRSNAGPG